MSVVVLCDHEWIDKYQEPHECCMDHGHTEDHVCSCGAEVERGRD